MSFTIEHDYRSRARAVELLRKEAGCDYLLISRLTDIRWLTGFTGSSGLIRVGENGILFATDGRYRTQVAQELTDVSTLIADTDVLGSILRGVQGTVLVQSDELSHSEYDRICSSFPEVKLSGRVNLLSSLRESKDSSEIELVRQALAITEATVTRCLERVCAGMTEKELAAEIDYEHAKSGSERPAFDTIVAFGENSALPHARPSGRRLKSGEIILIDCGCTIDGYASDMTRCVGFGEIDSETLHVYEIVQSSVDLAIAAAKSGMKSSDLDAVAREAITAAGYGHRFVHSLGHGVGLDVHETPRIGKNVDSLLPINGIVTIEPGIYIPGQFGIRIEEMVLLRSESAIRLNTSSTAFTSL